VTSSSSTCQGRWACVVENRRTPDHVLAKKNSISFLWAHAWWSFADRRSVFSNPDLLIYLIIHRVKHEFARLIWVLDIARALADLSDDDLNEVFKLAKTLGVEGGFLTSCELARYSLDTVLPSGLLPPSSDNR
jgi:hypothetical protein